MKDSTRTRVTGDFEGLVVPRMARASKDSKDSNVSPTPVNSRQPHPPSTTSCLVHIPLVFRVIPCPVAVISPKMIPQSLRFCRRVSLILTNIICPFIRTTFLGILGARVWFISTTIFSGCLWMQPVVREGCDDESRREELLNNGSVLRKGWS
jgi:hypothetical protein